jgi:hypothetical protein
MRPEALPEKTAIRLPTARLGNTLITLRYPGAVKSRRRWLGGKRTDLDKGFPDCSGQANSSNPFHIRLS